MIGLGMSGIIIAAVRGYGTTPRYNLPEISHRNNEVTVELTPLSRGREFMGVPSLTSEPHGASISRCSRSYVSAGLFSQVYWRRQREGGGEGEGGRAPV